MCMYICMYVLYVCMYVYSVDTFDLSCMLTLYLWPHLCHVGYDCTPDKWREIENKKKGLSCCNMTCSVILEKGMKFCSSCLSVAYCSKCCYLLSVEYIILHSVWKNHCWIYIIIPYCAAYYGKMFCIVIIVQISSHTYYVVLNNSHHHIHASRSIGADCQTQHWPRHKPKCKEISAKNSLK